MLPVSCEEKESGYRRHLSSNFAQKAIITAENQRVLGLNSVIFSHRDMEFSIDVHQRKEIIPRGMHRSSIIIHASIASPVFVQSFIPPHGYDIGVVIPASEERPVLMSNGHKVFFTTST